MPGRRRRDLLQAAAEAPALHGQGGRRPLVRDPRHRPLASASRPTRRCSTATSRRWRSASTTCSGSGSSRTARAASSPSSRSRTRSATTKLVPRQTPPDRRPADHRGLAAAPRQLPAHRGLLGDDRRGDRLARAPLRRLRRQRHARGREDRPRGAGGEPGGPRQRADPPDDPGRGQDRRWSATRSTTSSGCGAEPCCASAASRISTASRSSHRLDRRRARGRSIPRRLGEAMAAGELDAGPLSLVDCLRLEPELSPCPSASAARPAAQSVLVFSRPAARASSAGAGSASPARPRRRCELLRVLLALRYEVDAARPGSALDEPCGRRAPDRRRRRSGALTRGPAAPARRPTSASSGRSGPGCPFVFARWARGRARAAPRSAAPSSPRSTRALDRGHGGPARRSPRARRDLGLDRGRDRRRTCASFSYRLGPTRRRRVAEFVRLRALARSASRAEHASGPKVRAGRRGSTARTGAGSSPRRRCSTWAAWRRRCASGASRSGGSPSSSTRTRTTRTSASPTASSAPSTASPATRRPTRSPWTRCMAKVESAAARRARPPCSSRAATTPPCRSTTTCDLVRETRRRFPAVHPALLHRLGDPHDGRRLAASRCPRCWPCSRRPGRRRLPGRRRRGAVGAGAPPHRAQEGRARRPGSTSTARRIARASSRPPP